MSYYKFDKDDVFYNSIKTHPESTFIIYSGSVYYNNKRLEVGQLHDGKVLHAPTGSLSLYELNVDRPSGDLIYPYVVKDGDLIAFKSVSTSSFHADYDYGDEILGTYPLTASIQREFVNHSGAIGSPQYYERDDFLTASRHIRALENVINYYRKVSDEFQFKHPERGTAGDTGDLGDGSLQINLISIPSIFYGSSIKKGTVDLKFFQSGSLIGRARDEKQNGELVHTEPDGHAFSGSTVGLVLYNEGMIIFTGSVKQAEYLSTATKEVYPPSEGEEFPKWIHFATTGSGVHTAPSSSFEINFQGTSYIETATMLAHAPKVALNHSNNPTYYQQAYLSTVNTSSYAETKQYNETPLKIKNTVSSSYNDPTGSFLKTTYISRVGIYDKDKNLIGVAKVATPVRKRENDSYTFKLKLDF